MWSAVRSLQSQESSCLLVKDAFKDALLQWKKRMPSLCHRLSSLCQKISKPLQEISGWHATMCLVKNSGVATLTNTITAIVRAAQTFWRVKIWSSSPTCALPQHQHYCSRHHHHHHHVLEMCVVNFYHIRAAWLSLLVLKKTSRPVSIGSVILQKSS